MNDDCKRRRRAGLAETSRVRRAPLEPFSIDDLSGDLSDAELNQIEYERDRLIELVARAEMWRWDSPFYTNEKLIAWLARDLRERAEVCGWVDEGMVDRITHGVYVRLQAARLGVADGGPCPPPRPVAEPRALAALVNETVQDRCAPRSDLAIAAGVGRELWDESCDSVVPLPEALADGRYLALRVNGDSMTPLIHSGDMVLVKLGSDVERDTVIVARGPDDGYVVKQVGELTRRRIELRSFNPEYASAVIPRDPARVLGTVILRWCDHGARHPGSASKGQVVRGD
jgi:hypothetical protein